MARQKAISMTDFTGGLNTFDFPWEVKDNQSPNIRNADFSRRGVIGKRTGWEVSKILSGESESIRGLLRYKRTGTNAKDALVVFCGRKIFAWEFGGEPVFLMEYPALAVDEIPTAVVRGAMFQSTTLFFGDGVHTSCRMKWDETLPTPAFVVESGVPKSNCFLADGVMMLLVDADAPSVVRWCHPNHPEVWNPDVTVDGGESLSGSIGIGNEGDAIGGMVIFQGEPFVFTRNEKFRVVRKIDTENAQVGYSSAEQDDGSDGSVAIGSVMNISNGIWFFGNLGFSSFGIVENFPDYRASKDFDFSVQNLLENFQSKNFNRMHSVKWKKEYWNALCLGNGNANNGVLVFDKFYNSWKFFDLPVSQFVVWQDKMGNDALFFGHSTDAKVCMMTKNFVDGENDENLAVNFVYESKHFRIGALAKFDWLIVEGVCTNPCTTKIFVNASGKETTHEILETDLREQVSVESTDGGIGDFVSGSVVLGSGNSSPLFRFRKKIHIPTTQNEAEIFWFRVENFGKNEPFSMSYSFLEVEQKANVR